MDPVTLIVTALAAGAALGVTDTASPGIRAAYAGLRALVLERLRDGPGAERVLTRFEQAPEAGRAALMAELGGAGAGGDSGLVAAAQALLLLVDEGGTRAGEYTVDARDAHGVQIGDRGTQRNLFTVPPDGLRPPGMPAGGDPGQRGTGEGAYPVDARGAMGVQLGAGSTQIIISVDRLTWTDGVEPPPLTDDSGMVESPYRGLSAFAVRDEAFFFGRETAVAQVMERMSRQLAGTGLLVVSGVSGAGKSSLLRAGVLPGLRQAGLASAPGSASWPCLLFTPAHAPLDELAVQVARLAGADAAAVRRELRADPASFALTARQAAQAQDGNPVGFLPGPRRLLLLVVDQFEQLFTQCPDEAQRQAFITALHAAATEPQGQGQVPAALVVLGVRADFEARCADYAQLADAVQDRYLVTSMTGRQLRMAIAEPARMAGARVEDNLVDVLLREIGTRQPGSPAAAAGPGAVSGAGVLPLLSHALDQAWRNRAGDTVTLADYEQTGGIEKAVGSSAQDAFDHLTPPQRDVARQVFTRLTATSTDGTDTADRASRAELTQGKNPAGVRDVDAVLEAFAAQRLLTLAAGTVEISHEVLLTAWPLLRDTWLAQTHADRIVRTRLHSAAVDWARHYRDPSYLYSGHLLAAAADTAARIGGDPARHLPLSQTDRDFLRASARARMRRWGQIVIPILMVIVAATVLFMVTLVTARHGEISAVQEADHERDVAVSGQLIAQSQALDDTNPALARLESIAAWRVNPSDQGRTLTRTEWARYTQGLPYQNVCP